LRGFACATILWLNVIHPGAPVRADDAKAGSTKAMASFEKDVVPFLNCYCTGCHGGVRPRAGLALDKFNTEAAALDIPSLWEKVAQYVRAHEMPPPSRRKQPTPEEIQQVGAWIDDALGATDCVSKKNPGRVTLRRLNRAEYNNTIRDLVGVQFQPAEDFPADDVGYGFDNIGDVLSLPPLLMERYLAAAEKIVAHALARPETRSRIFIAQPQGGANHEECARKILENFARRAYRRPVSGEEVNRLLIFVRLAEAQGDSWEKGIEMALQAILASPHFLFRVERDPRSKFGGNHRISDFELATRLSYFLWSSLPDEELFAQAQKGTLRQDVEGQVRRMLKHPRSRALVDNFATQWLQTRNLRNAAPDPAQFPDFDESLRSAMQRETELFFESIMRDDRSVLDFIDANYTYLNERLARHYGISGVTGEHFRRVTLPPGARGGVLTQASILTVTSNPTRTSPVKRGKWILENILGTPPPPPPPDAGELSEDKKIVLSGSLRKRMEQHRANPNCATCHQRMDPLGFGFENFDAIGKWRERDGQFPIDPSGVLPGGRSFQGPSELRAILKSQRELFCRCLTEKTLTFALGRGLEAYDKCALDQISGALAKDQYRFSRLVVEIARSDPFQMRTAGKR
jgi:hypothetical protein